MSPDEIFAGLGDLEYRYSHGDYNLSRSSMKEIRARYFPDRHFEPVEEGGVRSYVMPVSHPWHQGYAVDLIAWPAPTLGERFQWVKRFDKYATRFKRASLFAIHRLAPAFNGGADPFFVYRTPHDLLRRRDRSGYSWPEGNYIDRAYGAVILRDDPELPLNRVMNIVAEDKDHARELSTRLGRPVRYVYGDGNHYYVGHAVYRGLGPLDRWIKDHTATV